MLYCFVLIELSVAILMLQYDDTVAFADNQSLRQ